MSTTDRAELELVEQARAGDEGSLGMLATRVGERVRRYLNRVTLDEERSQDLTQETLVSVLESLGTLRQTERFWPWVFRIATNKARQHHRYEARRQALPMSSVSETHLPISRADGQGGLTQLSRKELGELTRQAMADVSDRYRMVLALRFFEDMPHSEIARALGCTELSARATFFRAKHALVRELRRRGVQSSALVAALAAFAELTAPPSAAAAEGVIAGLLSTKAKLAGGVIAALLAVALVWNGQGAARQSASAGGEPDVRFMHFAQQAAETGIAGGNSSQSHGCYEEWMHLPEGRGGPLYRRVQRWTPDQKNKQCWWVQNGDGHYYVYAGEPSAIHVQNAPLCSSSGLVTTVLPTDPQPFCEFVRGIEGDHTRALVDTSQITYQRDQKTGLPRSRVDRRFPNLGPFETVYEYEPFDLKLFDAPAGLPVRDERDEMHRRGWTYFRIEGWLAGKPVSGTGRLPFVHNASKTHRPWLQLQMDGRPVAADDGTHAWRLDQAGVAQVYPGGALFRGLSRPWMGFHTLDTIRRDAAAERIWFSTTLFEWDKPADVTLVAQRGPRHCKLRYTVDMERDTLERIEIWSDEEGVFSQRTGDLRFVYLDEVDNLGNQFAEPPRLESPPSPAPAGGEATILWPIELLGGSRDGALGPPVARAPGPTVTGGSGT